MPMFPFILEMMQNIIDVSIVVTTRAKAFARFMNIFVRAYPHSTHKH